jgi:hypothetical protein
MEEGEQRGECLRCTQESQELILAERDGTREERKRAKKLLDEKLQALSASSRLHRPWQISLGIALDCSSSLT